MSGMSEEKNKAVLNELFSPPRVNGALASQRVRRGVVAGTSFDLIQDPSTGERWDFLKASHPRECWKRLECEDPWIVIGSPPRTAFSAWNTRLNFPKMNPDRVDQKVAEGRLLLGFALSVYWWQVARGRYFLHEHPRSASSWELPEVKKVMGMHGVKATDCDMCAFGMPITFLTSGNSQDEADLGCSCKK